MSELKAGILPVTPFQQNCTLLWQEESKKGVVVDPGGDVPQIIEAIKQTGLTVENILLTHGHIDHAGGAKALKEELDCPIIGPHLDDKFLLDSLSQQGAAFGLGASDAQDVTPDQWLSEGDKVQIGGHDFEVLLCPGHTPGHVVFLNKTLKILIGGDVLFQGSIGRTDFPYGDHDALLNAIKTKLLPLEDDVAVFCGHGPMTTIGDERRNNPFLR